MNELAGRFEELRRALDVIEAELDHDTLPQERLLDLKVAVDDVRASLLAILTGARSERYATQIAEFRIQRAIQLGSNIHSDLVLGIVPAESPARPAFIDAMLALLKRIQSAQQQQAHAQKMETVGTLAGGIAHDFNNLLTPIKGYLSMALEDLSPESPTYQDLVDAKRAASRAERLVRQILTFSRRGESEKRHGLIQGVVREATELVRASMPASIQLDVSICDDCPPVCADETQIHQIVMNLATNGYHAMQDRAGRLTVSLDTVDVSPEMPARPAVPVGTYVRLVVSDQGRGMDPATMERLFEPFFTTKQAGRGTGLGLAVVHGIVEDHEGDIVVQSTPGVGSTLTVYLPVAEQPSMPDAHAQDEVLPGEGRLMLVEDDADIVRMLSKQLERLGYRVTATSDTAEGLDMVRSDPEGFDLVITDYMMPGMTGLILARAMRAVRPELPMILISGNLGQLDGFDLSRLGFSACLKKPLDVARLSASIRTALHADEVARTSA